MWPTATVIVAAAALAFGSTCSAQDSPDIAALERKVRDDGRPKDREALAEAYLHDCRLAPALEQFRAILKADPDHPRAKTVVARLTAQMLDVDSHLALVDRLMGKGVTTGVDDLLNALANRPMTDAQKAMVLYFRGRRAIEASPAGGQPGGWAHLESAVRLYPHTGGAVRSAVLLARADAVAGRTQAALDRLGEVLADRQVTDAAARDEAWLELARTKGRDRTPDERLGALGDVRDKLKTPPAKRRLLAEIVRLQEPDWKPETIDAAVDYLRLDPPADEAREMQDKIASAARSWQDSAMLSRLFDRLSQPPLPASSLLRAEVALNWAASAGDPAAVEKIVAEADKLLADLGDGGPDRLKVTQLKGRRLLVQAQKLAVLGRPMEALPVLLRAKDHYLSAMASPDCDESFARLANIAALLEHLNEWETAVELYRELAGRFAHLAYGREALARVAELCEKRLDDPVAAVEAWAEYAARYPAEIPYRQLSVGQRLARLGYANVLDFQRRNNLKTDGLLGPASATKLAQLEAIYDQVRLGGQDRAAAPVPVESPIATPAAADAAGTPKLGPQPVPTQRLSQDDFRSDIIRGKFVHTEIFRIASRLENGGRPHEAVAAYELFVNLFPTKAQADDAMIAVARIFRDNRLFDEALGAYRRLMDDWPNGDQTSLAYTEAAGCLENLGRWTEARELYELYAKKFPKYPLADLCRRRLVLLDQVRQYEDFIRTAPASAKLPEARYQIASLLYKEFGNLGKAAGQFVQVADLHPKHVRAADGLFTAATCLLQAEDFAGARKLFARVVAAYKDTRLADDAQYWIGHTYEYSARALGKLDDARIVLRRRTLAGRGELTGDLALRRRYFSAARFPDNDAQDGPGWAGSVLTSGAKRDRVNAELLQAVREYRKVVDEFKLGDMAGAALLRIGAIYTEYLNAPEKGIEAYRELLAHYPGSRQAVDALYEVGGYQMSGKDYDEAVKSYQQFIYNYPNEAKVEDAMLAIAKCHVEKRAWDKALDAFQAYLAKFPSGKGAEFARSQAEWIRMYHF